MQLAAGAAGISLAKTSEAEVFADAGFDDIFIAYPVVGLGKAERLLALSDRLRLAVGMRQRRGRDDASRRPFAPRGEGSMCCSRSTAAITASASCPRTLAESRGASRSFPGIRLRGVFTHAGHAYQAETPEAVAEIGRQEGEILVADGRSAPAGRAFPSQEVSVGSTPTARHAMRVAGRHRVPPRQLRLPRRLAGRPGNLRPRRLRDDHPRDRRQRPRARPRRSWTPARRPSRRTLCARAPTATA